MSIVLRALVVMPWAVFDLIERSVMLATIFYFQRNILKAWLQGQAIKSGKHYLAAQTTSFIVLMYGLCVGSSVKFRARLSNHKSHQTEKEDVPSGKSFRVSPGERDIAVE